MEDGIMNTLEVRNMSKTFGGQRALDNVSLFVKPGEVHGLLGQNGSGKSTLIKILAGYHIPDPGATVEINGRHIKLPLQPGEFRNLGMSFVHQDLGLIPSLSVIENLFVGKLALGNSWYIPWTKERNLARAIFSRYGLNIDPSTKVSELTQVEKALLAIVRAVEDIHDYQKGEHSESGLLVLDEPTVFLPKTGVDQLFRLIREIVKTGVSVLFVSHDLDEVLDITDRITILRDGRVAKTTETTSINKAQLIELIIGHEVETIEFKAPTITANTVDISVSHLSGKIANDVSFNLRRGEVLGLTGLVGSGFEEIPYLLYGAYPEVRGVLTLDGNRLDLALMNPYKSIKAGIALLPGDRQNAGGVGLLSITDNINIPVIDRYFKGYTLDRKAMSVVSQSLLNQYDVRPNNPKLDFQNLSGGNQQKVLIAKWFQTNPKLFLVDEPTQGVDVGARQQVFKIIRTAASTGTCVICSSSDYEQLATICDRVLIFGRGQIISELAGKHITKDRITEQCYNSLDGAYV